MTYRVNREFAIHCGFDLNYQHIDRAIEQTNAILQTLPSTLYRSIDYKTTSSIIGAIFCEFIASLTGTIVNPIEKGHPDVIPPEAENSPESILRNYPVGLEVKCTVVKIKKGSNLRAGQTRVNCLTEIRWQAHHRENVRLLGLVWDFVQGSHEFNYPTITAAFYSSDLIVDDWGDISGTDGRNTKVTGMTASGRLKMGQGWIAVIDDPEYIERYQQIMEFKIREKE